MILGGQRGDGQITVAEFLEGAIRLRGLAKSVDLAQVGEVKWMEIRIPEAGEMWAFWKVSKDSGKCGSRCKKQNHKQAENEWNMTYEEREVSH